MRLRTVGWLATAACATLAHLSLAQGPSIRLGAMGDSYTDEYTEETYGAIARSWSQLLVVNRNISMGPTAIEANVGYWGEPRRSGFQDNWARYSATSDNALAGGQAEGVASGFESRGTTHAVIFIGGNDFSPWSGPYNIIYNGGWTVEQQEEYFASRLHNFDVFLSTIQQQGQRVVLVSVLDFSIMPFVWGGHGAPWARVLVTDVVASFNEQLKQLARRYGVVYLDLFRLNLDLFGSNENLHEIAEVGGEEIQLRGSGIDPHNAFIPDSAHPQTIIQLIWANAILEALDTGYTANVPLFTEREMTRIAGLVYNDGDTLGTYIAPYRSYILNFACRADFNADQSVTVQDLFDFLSAYFASDAQADIDHSEDVSVQDVFDYLGLYFAGCPGE